MNLSKYSGKFSKKKIILLSIPVFLSNLAIPLVGMVDTGLMGNLGETKYLAATSIAASVMTMIIWSFGFLRMGTVGIVSQAYGRGDYREIVKTLLRNFVIALFIALAIIISKPLIYSSIQYFFNTSLETQKLINTYLNVRVFSVPAELSIYILVGFYLGIQKTKISSLLIVLLSVLNIVFSSLLVLSYNLNVFGVALGTLAASYITMIIFIIFTYNFIINKFKIIPRFEKLIVKSKLLKLFNINFDIFIRTLFLTFSFLWVTYQGSKLGENYLAINTLLMQFIMFASFFLDAYAFSTEAVIGYTIGRKVKKSFLEVVTNSFQLSIFSGLVISLIYLFTFRFIINELTDLDYLRFLTFNYIFWIIIIPPVASICYQFDGIFIGASQTSEMRNGMIVSVVLFLTSSQFLVNNFGNHGLWLSLLFFMIIRSVTLNYYFNRILKKF